MLNKEEILQIVEKKTDSYTQIIKAHHKDLYSLVFSNYEGKKFGEKLYRYIHKEEKNLGKCLICGKETKFMSFSVGFTSYCCRKCANIGTLEERVKTMTHEVPDPKYWETKNCIRCGKEFSSRIKMNQRFCSNDCSAAFTANDETRLNRIKQTKLEKYGNPTFVNPEKAKKTCLKKYGVDNASKSPDVIKRIQQSNQEKYGVNWSWQNEEVKEKIKKSSFEKYGTENPSSSEVVKEKRSNTNIDRYGIDNLFRDHFCKDKIIKTNQSKHGCDYPSQNTEIKEKATRSFLHTIFPKVKETNQDKVDFLFTEEEYKGTHRSNIYKFRCKKCGNEFEDHLDAQDRPRCLVCNPYIAGFSLMEKAILEYVRSICPSTENIIEKDRSVLGNRELDIYLPDRKLAIEFDGAYWHSEKSGGKDPNYHLNKTIGCEEKGIQLLHIFEDEWIEKQEIVKSMLKHRLCFSDSKIHARKCKIGNITWGRAREFLLANHIQGPGTAAINLGLFYEDKLVAVATFGKLRISLGSKSREGKYELIRYATSSNVVGGCGKLVSYFVRFFQPLSLISYADRRWSLGNMYKKIGFERVSATKPNYWYFLDGEYHRFHRFSFRKDQLDKKLVEFDPFLTEWENMKNNGFDRLWDCGSLKFEWKP